jgi:hypothetical protein
MELYHARSTTAKTFFFHQKLETMGGREGEGEGGEERREEGVQ